MSTTLLQQHDELLSNQPEGVEHDAAACPFCNGSFSGEQASEGGVMSTYTEEELATRISDAVAPFEARIRELEASHEQAALEAKLAEVTQPLQEQIDELQTKLDSAILEAETAKTEYATLVEYLEGLKQEEAAQAEFAALKEERLALVREVAAFPEEHMEANADRWARMDQETFDGVIADWKQISEKASKDLTQVPAETAMQASAPAKSADDGKSLMREMFDMTVRGIDPRKV